ncbi:MAG: helix-turn-helix domain-containing protein [Chthoniobacteraceae bacterium]
MDHDFGKHLQKARTDRGLSIEQAAAAVRIRSTFLRALENSDLTKFANAAYAKSFLLMYGRFLGVDLHSIAAQIDTTTQMKVEGYQYLTNRATDQPKAKQEPELTFSAAPPPKASGTWLPLLVLGATIIIAVVGFIVWSNMNRLGNSQSPAPVKNAERPAGASAVEPLKNVPAPAPRPAPADGAAPPAGPPQTTSEAPTPRPAIISAPIIGAASADPSLGEIPRARPISPVARLAASDSDVLAEISPPKPRVISSGTRTAPPVPAPATIAEEEGNTPAADPNAIVLEPHRKTWVVIRTGPGGQPLFEDYLYPGAKPLRLPKGRYFIELKDAGAVEITRNGQRIGYTSPGVLVE